MIGHAAGTFLVVAALVFLRDPVLMYAALLAFQVLLFPAMGWQTFALGMVALSSIYMSHDLVLGDEKAFFVRVDRALRSTTWLMLVLITVGYVFQAALKLVRQDFSGSWEVARKAFPIMIIVLVYHVVEVHADGTMFDNAVVAFDYGRTIMDYTVKYTQFGANALFARRKNTGSSAQFRRGLKPP